MKTQCNTNICRGQERTYSFVGIVSVDGCHSNHHILACEVCGFRRMPASSNLCACGEPENLDITKMTPIDWKLKIGRSRKLRYRPQFPSKKGAYNVQ